MIAFCDVERYCVSMAGASEFGGNGVQANGVFPSPHVPTASERLMLLYRTGDESGLMPVDTEGVVWTGMLPAKEQRDIRQAAGDLDVGQEWDALKQAADAELQSLQNETRR